MNRTFVKIGHMTPRMAKRKMEHFKFFNWIAKNLAWKVFYYKPKYLQSSKLSLLIDGWNLSDLFQGVVLCTRSLLSHNKSKVSKYVSVNLINNSYYCVCCIIEQVRMLYKNLQFSRFLLF